MTLAINKMDRHGLSNTACHKHLPKTTKVMRYQLTTERLPYSSNKTEHLNYTGEWANTHLCN